MDTFAQHLTAYGTGTPRNPCWVSWGHDPNEAMVNEAMVAEFVASI